MSTEAKQKRVTITLTAADWQLIRNAYRTWEFVTPYERQDSRFVEAVPLVLRVAGEKSNDFRDPWQAVEITWGENGWPHVSSWILSVCVHGANRPLADVGARIAAQYSRQTMGV